MNNRTKLEVLEAALRQAQGFINGSLRGYRLREMPLPAEIRSVLVDVARALGAAQPKTSQHDAGAIARCSYCGRYTSSHMALSPRLLLRCDCGMLEGWSGSFARPTPESDWSISSEWVSR